MKLNDMEILMSILLMLSSVQCRTNNEFSILKAEYQQFAGGTVWSSSGTNYNIQLKAERNLKNLKFLVIWVGQTSYIEVEALSGNQAIEFSDVDKGETVNLKFSRVIQNRQHNNPYFDNQPQPVDSDNQGSIDQNIKVPFEYSGAALISYIVKGKKKYIVVPEFVKLKPLMMP